MQKNMYGEPASDSYAGFYVVPSTKDMCRPPCLPNARNQGETHVFGEESRSFTLIAHV